MEKMFGWAMSVAVLLVFTSSQYARAQTSGLSKSDCGSPPSQFAESETHDTKIGGGFSGIFKIGAANGDYEKAVKTTRQEVYSHYPNADKLDRRQYADYVTCVIIMTEPDLNDDSKRLKAWLEYQKIIKDLPGPPSPEAALRPDMVTRGDFRPTAYTSTPGEKWFVAVLFSPRLVSSGLISNFAEAQYSLNGSEYINVGGGPPKSTGAIFDVTNAVGAKHFYMKFSLWENQTIGPFEYDIDFDKASSPYRVHQGRGLVVLRDALIAVFYVLLLH